MKDKYEDLDFQSEAMKTHNGKETGAALKLTRVLGPLPSPHFGRTGFSSFNRPYENAYSADQMIQYAKNAVAKERTTCARVCIEVGEDGAGMAGEVWAERCAKAILMRNYK